MEKELSEVAVEINSIFDNMSLEILNKIPIKIQNFFKEIASDTYTFKYDSKKCLNEQKLKDKTRGIIALLYRDYVCNDEERNEYNNEYNNYINSKEKEKREIYNTEKIFKNKKENIVEKNYYLQTIPEKENILKKLFNKIKNFFKKKN